VAHYLFNSMDIDPETGSESLRAGVWGVAPGEPYRDALAAGDLVLFYLGAPNRVFIGWAELGSAVRDWTPGEALAQPGTSGGVLLADVWEWDPPVPMDAVLAQIESPAARGDFEAGVVRITASEYETALRVAAEGR
jgi:hypothetical protein